MKISVSELKRPDTDGGGDRYVCMEAGKHVVPIMIRIICWIDRSCFRVVLAPSQCMTASLNHTSLSEETDAAAQGSRCGPVDKADRLGFFFFFLHRLLRIWCRFIQSAISALRAKIAM